MENKHWHLQTDENNIIWLCLDRADSSVNSLKLEVLTELDDILNSIDSNARGMIIYSGKKTGFIAGADIEQFTKLTTQEQAIELIKQGQDVFNKLEQLKIPTLTMIQGFCLGGGLELALACRYRIAEDSGKTKIGLPEVKLGIHPGWGGTVRLPKLIGAPQALSLILSGKALSAHAAKKLGIVDEAVPERQLKRAATNYILNPPQAHTPGKLLSFTNHKLVRPLLGKYIRKQLASKANEKHYPAPFAALDNWMKYGVSKKAMQEELQSIGRLFMTDTAKNLVHVFFLQERLKNLAKDSQFKAKHIHVIGAGTMGGDIAAWCALRGFTVTLQDREPQLIGPAIKRAAGLYNKKLKLPHLITETLDKLIPDPDGLGIAKADVIIEAVFEDLTVKQTLFKALEEKAKPDAILATNTSSIPLNEIYTVLKNPSRLVGIHFFNPVAMMPLVEIVKAEKTSQDVINNTMAFVGKLGKLPLPVKSSPGFLVNRVLMPYLLEAMTMFEEGISATDIDQAAIDFGMPMGPIELADTVGLDVCLAVADNLAQHLGGEVPEKLRDMVAAKQLGRKTSIGFYRYQKNKPLKGKAALTKKQQHEITDRLVLRLLNESAACLREGIVDDTELLDAGMIFGTGFAPFRGGPMHYARQLGAEKIKQQYSQYSQLLGERFRADTEWSSLLPS